MSATNSTTNYELPLFESSDVPSWEGDFNEAMNKVDMAIKSVADTVSGLSSDVSGLSGDVGGLVNSLSSLSTAFYALRDSLNNSYKSMEVVYPASVMSMFEGKFKTMYYNRNTIQIQIACFINNYDNSTIVNGVAYTPLYKITGNVLNLQLSTLTSPDYKYALTFLQGSNGNGAYIEPRECFAYWDGTNTVIAVTTSEGSVRPLALTGNVTTLNAGLYEG